MVFGISTACLYPLHTEDAFEKLASLGAAAAEVFANSTPEAQEPLVSQMAETACRHNMTITSLHPFSSPMESVFLFSEYDRRVDEMLALYRGFFRGMNTLGAKIFVLHGAILSSNCSHEHYIRQFRLMAQAGREYGITIAQENV
ncbi:MAG: sugar phosphate isomerase/epimerase family protein, partial [Oscillospiraceae bacterium]